MTKAKMPVIMRLVCDTGMVTCVKLWTANSGTDGMKLSAIRMNKPPHRSSGASTPVAFGCTA